MRILELYAGIGGCAAAFGPGAEVVAVEQSPAAAQVYGLNFSHPVRPQNLVRIEPEVLTAPGADLWWMSPPCQSFTLRGARKDLADQRAESLPHVLSVLRQARPRFVGVENVPGFVGSEAQAALHDALDGYESREYLLCPTDLGIPMRRLRYYLVAAREGHRGEADRALAPAQARLRNDAIGRSPRPSPLREDAASGPSPHPGPLGEHPAIGPSLRPRPLREGAASGPSPRPGPLGEGPAIDPSPRLEALREDPAIGPSPQPKPLRAYLDPERFDEAADLQVSAERRRAYEGALNIVERDDPDAIATCFTSAYGRSPTRAGSYLRTPGGLRHFAPEEIARFMGFGRAFRWPQQLGLRKRWSLIGNSLSVDAVRAVLSTIADHSGSSDGPGST